MNIPRPLLISLVLALGACAPKEAPPPSAPVSAVTSLEKTDIKVGEGPEIAAGQIAVVQYTGWLYESAAQNNQGKQFDSSREAGREAFKFPLGTGSVIKGWDQGVLGMKVGGRRRLVIPPDLAYGDEGAQGAIPPGATLIFDVELVGIEKP